MAGPFPAEGSVLVAPVEHPAAQPLDVAKASLHDPPPFFFSPLVQHVEEQVSHGGVGAVPLPLGSSSMSAAAWMAGAAGAAQGVLTW